MIERTPPYHKGLSATMPKPVGDTFGKSYYTEMLKLETLRAESSQNLGSMQVALGCHTNYKHT